MKKRILSLFLALLLIMGVIPTAVFAENSDAAEPNASAGSSAGSDIWDGETKTEPNLVDDVYQIETGSELAWFVDYYITQKTPVSGKLMADIELGGHDWVATTNIGNGKNFILDGQGHAIRGLNAKHGLIGAIGGSSRIQNLSVYGTVGGDGLTRVGGIVGYVGGGTIENCVNYTTITVTNSGKDIYAGGIAGNCYNDNVVIRNCANHGNVVCTGNQVGGIAGYFGKKTTIVGCYNTGDISGTSYVGGIVGNSNNKKSAVTACYNTGDISGTSDIGGLLGQAAGNGPNNKMTVQECYSSGMASGTSNVNALFGTVKNLTTIHIYFLRGHGTDDNGIGLTDSELKAADLDTEYFQPNCGTYPALVWQTDAKPHTSGEQVETIPADCENGGAVKVQCTVCGETYVSETTEALGHQWCTHNTTETCEHCFYDPAPTSTETGILKRTCMREGCSKIQEEVTGMLVAYTVTLPTNTTGYTVVPEEGTSSTVPEGGDYRFTIVLEDGYEAAGLLVKANDQELSEEAGVYTIKNITEDQTITVSGVVTCDAASYTVSVSSGAGYTVAVKNGSASPVREGGNYRFTLNIEENYETSELCVQANDVELIPENGVYTIYNITADQVVTITGVNLKMPDASITVPSDATVFVGSKGNAHFVPFTEIQPAGTRVHPEQGTTTYYYSLKNNREYNYRISGENYITYASVFNKTANYQLTVTEADLKPEGKSKTTVDHDTSSNNGLNVADIWLNINAQNYLKLDAVDDTYQLVNLRNWQTTNSETANYFIEPDYHYTVIDEYGQTSDRVVTVSDSGLVTAVGPGTAIVMVTYDAINIPSAMGGPFFGAIWPENTGVFVVSVGADDSGIDIGMTINETINADLSFKNDGTDLDAEHDVIYYTGSMGSYAFTPGTKGLTVSVAHPIVTTSMSFNGFESVQGEKDGSFQIPLVEGRNIVKLEKDGKVEYQVITAKHVTVSINDGEVVRPGDAVSIKLDTIYHPMNKLSGVYNYHATIVYTEVEGQEGKMVGGQRAQYTFASTPSTQTVSYFADQGEFYGAPVVDAGETFIIPEDYTDTSLTLSGGTIAIGGWGSWAGEHRGINLTDGKLPNLNAESPFGYLSQLPDIVIPIAQQWPEVEQQIQNLPNSITLENKAEVEAAKTAYDALNDAEKARISEETTEKLNKAVKTIAWLENSANGYAIFVGEGSQISVGEQAEMAITIANNDETTYNAYDLTVCYDADKLTYTGINVEDATVTDKDGVLHIVGYGADKACGTDNLILTFTGKATGEAKVTVTKANIDLAANANVQDAPAATIVDAEAIVSVNGYKVELSDDFNGDGTVEPGADYTFTAKDKNYDYVIDATMGGEKADVVNHGDGTYTIQDVHGNLVITNTKTAKTYDVTVEGSGAADAAAADKATYLTDYTFRVTQDDKYTYAVSATVAGQSYNLTQNENGTYTIAGADVTGDIVITVVKEKKPVTETQINFVGSGSEDVIGGTTQTAPNGTDFVFEVNKTEGYDYTVTLGGQELTPNEEGKYTIPGNQLTGEVITVTVEKTEQETMKVNAVRYIDLDGKTIWLVTASGTVSEDAVLAYDGNAMFWSDKYEAYCYLVISEQGADAVKADAAGKIAEASAEKVSISYDGDVNETGVVDINDAQLTYDLYNAKYDSFETVSMLKFLEADVNGDATVNVTDAATIIAQITNG